jgi:predicted AlkP superfamily pyrophosphatase or phosphodiesterase
MKRRYDHIAFLLVTLFSVTLFGQPDSGDDYAHTVVLISMDGFRWDYLDKAPTPNIHRLIQNGVQAKGLIPPFPSKTFPSHYSIVTGLYPEHHGIVANTMYDPEFKALFTLANTERKKGRWYGGEPVWITAQQQGKRCATLFWPGSDVEIKGMFPTYWREYDKSLTAKARVEQILQWLDMPKDTRAQFYALYLEDTDEAGHEFGPESAQTRLAIQRLDSAIGFFIDNLEQRGIFEKLNIVLLSDHGMTTVSNDSVIFIDDGIAPSVLNVVEWNPVLMCSAKSGNDDSVFTILHYAHPHLKMYRKQEMPERFHYTNHRRITSLLGLADEGWTISTHHAFESKTNPTRGTHGYDNRLKSMMGIFIAHGPVFKRNWNIDEFENLHLYNVLAFILGIQPSPNDGDLLQLQRILN